MERKRIPVEPQDYDKVAHFEASASHWSLEHTRLSLKAMDALSTVRDLTTAKNQIVESLCKKAEIETAKVVQVRLVREGDKSFMEVMVHEEPVIAAPDTEAPPVEPAAPAS